MTSRISFTPAVTADNRSKFLLVVDATNSAKVVFPVPGGPHTMIDDKRSDSIKRRNGPLGPTKCS